MKWASPTFLCCVLIAGAFLVLDWHANVTGQEKKTVEMPSVATKWQYKFVRNFDASALEAEVNRLANEGWEWWTVIPAETGFQAPGPGQQVYLPRSASVVLRRPKTP